MYNNANVTLCISEGECALPNLQLIIKFYGKKEYFFPAWLTYVRTYVDVVTGTF